MQILDSRIYKGERDKLHNTKHQPHQSRLWDTVGPLGLSKKIRDYTRYNQTKLGIRLSSV